MWGLYWSMARWEHGEIGMPAVPPDYRPEPVPDARPETDDQVERWRHSQLLEAGWEDPQAFLLAVLTDVDLHVACDLLRSGCDPLVAWTILT